MNASCTTPETQKTMTDFSPFQAWHYDPATVPFKNVIAPPYDVISPAEQDELYKRSPYNCVRLILNKIETNDTETSNRYTRARDFFNAWCGEKILIQDKTPCFYLYRQTYQDLVHNKKTERLALLGRLKLEPFEKGIVIPHEKTLSKPRADRRKLLEATHINFSPVFGLYEDPQAKIASLYKKVTSGQPLFDVTDEKAVQQTVWVIDQPEFIREIQQALKEKKIYIADGHHRYQTALEYARDQHAAQNIPADKVMPFDYVLMALVEFNDPGLLVFPTHRMIRSLKASKDNLTQAQALERLKPIFKVEALDLETIQKKIETSPAEKIVFGLVLDHEQFLLTLEDKKSARSKMPAGKPDIWYDLDLNVLSYLILGALWSIPESEWEGTIQYTRSAPEAIAGARGKQAEAAFLLKAPKVEMLREMGKVKELMPQKSTYFYPKLASGLVFHQHSPTLN